MALGYGGGFWLLASGFWPFLVMLHLIACNRGFEGYHAGGNY